MEVVSPAHDGLIFIDDACVCLACADEHRSWGVDADVLDRGLFGVDGGAVPELSIGIQSPTLDGTVVHDGAGVVVSCREVDGEFVFINEGNLDGDVGGHGHGDAELAVLVVSPAVDVGFTESTGVSSTSDEVGDVGVYKAVKAGNLGGLMIGRGAAFASLGECVASPAEDISVECQRAGVLGSGDDLGDDILGVDVDRGGEVFTLRRKDSQFSVCV